MASGAPERPGYGDKVQNIVLRAKSGASGIFPEQVDTNFARSPLRKFLHGVVTHWAAEAFVVCLIGMNLIIMVFEADAGAKGLETPVALQVVTITILVLYTIELLAKLWVFRLHFFWHVWNWIDMVIVLADYVMLVLESTSDGAVSISYLRLFRMLRLARTARIVKFFPQLALMVTGLIATLRVVACGLVLLMGTLAIIGVMSTQILHPVNLRVAEKGLYDGCERCPRAFETTFASALTFTQQIITGDSWGAVSIPIIEESPATLLFFFSVFIFIQLMVLNVILSMVVESSIQAAEDDKKRILRLKERDRKDRVDEFKALCAQLDTDGSGLISQTELRAGFDENSEFQELMGLMELTADDIDAVFGILDKDGSGDISYDEFIEELFKMKSHDSHTLLVFIKFYVSEIKGILTQFVQSEFAVLHNALGSVREDSKEVAKAALTKTKPDTMYDILQEVRSSLNSDVSRVVDELSQKADRHNEAIGELLGRLTLDYGEERKPPACKLPRSVPQPQVEDPPWPREPEAGRPAHGQIGPLCHYVGRGRGDVIHTGGGSAREAQPPGSSGRRPPAEFGGKLSNL